MPGSMDRSKVEKLIRSSRDRSQLKYSLSSTTKSPILRLQEDETKLRSEQFLERIGGAAAEVDKSALLPNHARYCMLITDADGIVIESYAPEGMEAEFERGGLVRGAVWDERVAGTNGIAMSMQTGRVLTVHGQDHFYNCFHDLSCSTAPLTDAENNLIGTVTLVGSALRRHEEHGLCEQVVRRASRQFQTRLFRNFHSDKLTGRVLSLDPKLPRRFETLVACDDDGFVISHLPLWRDDAKPPAHQHLVGQHITDLKDLDISLRGPVAIPPRRRVINANMINVSARIEKETELGRIIAEGGTLPVLAERARKLVAHRVPLLICGEPGVGAENFARALLEDASLISPMGNTLDAARSSVNSELSEALSSLEFLADYPIDRVVPTLILRNIECLPTVSQSNLERFLDANQVIVGSRAQPPIVIFTSSKSWAELESDDNIPASLLYLLGQSIVELPPVAQRDCETVLENVVADGFSQPFEIAESARDLLIRHDWPGNHREMHSVLREALICGNGRRINVTDLPARLLSSRDRSKTTVLTRSTLRDALDSTNWNVTKAARLLGKSRATVNRWIASEGLQRPE